MRLARFENDRTISFIPPDGEFELMSYRLNTQAPSHAPQPPTLHPLSHTRPALMTFDLLLMTVVCDSTTNDLGLKTQHLLLATGEATHVITHVITSYR